MARAPDSLLWPFTVEIPAFGILILSAQTQREMCCILLCVLFFSFVVCRSACGGTLAHRTHTRHEDSAHTQNVKMYG